MARRQESGSAPEAEELSLYLRAANYLAAAQIYLQSNPLLAEPLQPEHVKPRLLGHWGTCPGINLVYAGLNRLILERAARVMLVTGPGHGAAANLANLWLEGSLAEIDPQLGRDRAGLFQLVRGFSWPDGFPSYLGPMVPGVIHEGGELGYALATAFGAALDNPDLIVACIVGDGEAETAPTAGAWHSSKFLDPVGSGAVLPVLHLNGHKISGPTLFATMDDRELTSLFEGYGWRPRIVQGPQLEAELGAALTWAQREIVRIQARARDERASFAPRWPMLILRSPKGWTGIRELDGFPIEGSFRSHQVPAKEARERPEQLAALERWLHSYRPDELFGYDGQPAEGVLRDCPSGDRRMGMVPEANGGRLRVALRLPDLDDHALDTGGPGDTSASALEATGGYLRAVFERNADARNFRLVSPDGLTSTKLGAVLNATDRAYQWPHADGAGLSRSGRVMEILSEHNCQGWLQGYVLTGRHGIFPSYEAFLAIVDGMVNQYAKFLKVAREVPWRAPVSSFNYLLTSEGWRQEHNGFSHQGPGFINSLLNKGKETARIYLPPDANTLLARFANQVVASKVDRGGLFLEQDGMAVTTGWGSNRARR